MNWHMRFMYLYMWTEVSFSICTELILYFTCYILHNFYSLFVKFNPEAWDQLWDTNKCDASAISFDFGDIYFVSFITENFKNIYKSIFCYRNCGLVDPTWCELRHFVYFLSSQLFKVDKSPFCSQGSFEDLPGFRRFVVLFMFRMAKVRPIASASIYILL